MKVCIVIAAGIELFDPTIHRTFGGAELRASLFARGLVEREFDVSVAVVHDPPPRPRPEYDGVSIITLSPRAHANAVDRAVEFVRSCIDTTGPRGWRFRRFPLRLLTAVPVAVFGWAWVRAMGRGRFPAGVQRRLAEIDADVFVCLRPSTLTANVGEYCRREGRRMVLMTASDSDLGPWVEERAEGYSPESEPAWVGHASYERAAAIVVQTDAQAALLRKHTGRDSELIRNPIPLGDETAQDNAPPPIDKPYTLWIGRANLNKRPEHCVALAASLPEHAFVMVMNPYDKAIDDAARAAAGENIHFVEHVPIEEIDHYFRHAMVLVNTSDYEGFPNTFLQAAKYRVPILSLRVDPDGMLSSHGAGVACEGYMDRLVAAHRDLVFDTARREQLGQAGRAYVEQYHSAADRIDELADVLRSVSPADRTKQQ